MKKTLLIVLIAAVAVSGQFSEGVGTTAHPLLKIGFGPRAAAMANSYVGLAPDITAMWWNPAGLYQLNTYEAMVSHHEWLRGIRDEFASLIWPQSPKNTIGFALNFTSASGIEHWDEENFPVADDSLIMTYEAIMMGSFTRQIGERFAAGATFKGLYENLYQVSGYGAAVDLSMHWKASRVFGLGMVVQNLGPGMFYPGGTYMFPMQAQVGAALTFEDVLHGLNLLTDVRVPLDNNVSVHVGGELWPLEILAARVGFQSGPQTLPELNFIAGMTAGVGLVLDNYRVDYAIAPYGHLGLTHRLALIAAFGERPRYGGVIVKVIDAETKESLAAHLEVEGITRAEKDLDQAGRWEKKGLNPGKVTARAEMEDYYASTGTAQVKAGQTAELVVALEKIPPGGITGQVYDVKTSQPLEATITYKGPKGVEGEITTDEEGNYTIPGLYRGSYTLYAQPDHPKYFPQDAGVTVKAGEETDKDFALLREKEVIVFHNIHFETGEARVLPEFYTALDDIGKILLANPSIKVELAGHTDSRPIETPEFPDNKALSQARVEAVKEYLVDRFNIDSQRLVAKGYGESQPIASNETEEGMAKNRRVEFKVLTGIEYYHEIRQEETKEPE